MRAYVLRTILGVVLAVVSFGTSTRAVASPCTEVIYEVGPHAEEIDFDGWTVDTFSFAEASYDEGKAALVLDGGFFPGTSAVLYEASNGCTMDEFEVSVTMFARSLEQGAGCGFAVSADGGQTWSTQLLRLNDGDDGAKQAAQTAVRSFTPDSPVSSVLLRMQINATHQWDYCYLESVRVRPILTTSTSSSTSTSTSSSTTTTTTTTSSTATAYDCAVPAELYSSDFSSTAEVNTWTHDEGVTPPDFGDGGLRIVGAGTASYEVAVDLAPYSGVEVFALLGAVDLGPTDSCEVQVSFDGFGSTSTPTVVSIANGDGSQVGGQALFSSATEATWNQAIGIRLVADVSGSSRCALQAIGVSGRHACGDVPNCDATCSGYSCDEWVENQGKTCEFLESYGCDCRGCACLVPTSTTSTTTSSSTSSTTSTTSTVPCPNTCRGNTCDFWFAANAKYTCELLETYDCDCRGCICELVTSTSETTPDPTTTSTSTTTTTVSRTTVRTTSDVTQTTAAATTTTLAPTSMTTPSCPQSCLGEYSCDHWVAHVLG